MTIKSKTNDAFKFDQNSEVGINMFDLRMDADESFDFGSQSLSCSSSCPSISGSFSSASSHDPFTPPSRNSTPQQHMTFETSFDGDNMIFDFTPPPSTTSSCFPLELKSTVAPNMLSHGHGLPTTPSRGNHIFDSALSLHNSLDFTPTQTIDTYNFADALGSSPFMLPTPSPAFVNSQQNCDATSIWGQHVDGSPITFSPPPLPLGTPTAVPLGSSHGNIKRRVAMDGPQQSSAMLQHHLQRTPTKSRTSRTRSTPAKSSSSGQRDYRVAKSVDRIPRGKFSCELCVGKVYTRQEHLKRHCNEAHKENPEKWTCEFCEPHPKTFGRSDNFRDHLKRHIGNSTGRRTIQNPAAAALLAKMESEMKTKKKRALKCDDSPSAISPTKEQQSDVKMESSPFSSPLHDWE